MKLLQDAEWSHWSDREIAKRAAGMNLFGACDPLKSCDLDLILHPERHDSVVMIKRRGSIMPTIFDFLYREYCRARLAEMRKQLLLVSAESHEVPEANCDVSHHESAGQRSGPSAGASWGRSLQREVPGEDRHKADVGSQSADSIIFCFRNTFGCLAFGSPVNISRCTCIRRHDGERAKILPETGR